MISSVVTAGVLTGAAVVSVAIYLLPVLIGWARHVPSLGAVAAINVLLGWSLVGWVVALALALRSVSPASPVVQLVQNLPPSPVPPSPLAGAGWAGSPGPPTARPAPAPPLGLRQRPSAQQGEAGRGQ